LRLPPAADTLAIDRGRERMAEHGTVKWYNAERGYGFITRPRGVDVLVHHSSLRRGVTSLSEGDRVTFDVKDGVTGLVALDVAPAPD
jgi:cold shock protein